MAQQINLEMDAGADFFARLTAFDANDAVADLTGYTGIAKIKDGVGGALKGSFVVTPNGALGTVDLFMDSVDTALIAGGDYVYDVLIQNATSGDSQRIAQGAVKVFGQVSQ